MKPARRHIQPVPTVVDGIRFDSKAESARYGALRMMERAGEIRDLEVHPRLPMEINGRKIGRGYLTLDFLYWEKAESGDWRLVFEDFKSVDTRESKVRREVCEAINNVEIRVVSR